MKAPRAKTPKMLGKDYVVSAKDVMRTQLAMVRRMEKARADIASLAGPGGFWSHDDVPRILDECHADLCALANLDRK